MTTKGRHWRRYRITGLVQGVGFRPTVWRLARHCGLAGHVINDAAGVQIEACGSAETFAQFEMLIRAEKPPISRIDSIVWETATPAHEATTFEIRESKSGDVKTGIVPDAAICPDCTAEILADDNRRSGYAFTNCTHCGPRLSIIHGIPYDRANTSMSAFTMCDDCREEYENPADRRFHAQPNACPKCGPKLWFEGADGARNEVDALAVATQYLREGKIVAIKGIGGFHLACDATNEYAISALRARKNRPSKPLALMMRDLAMVQDFASFDTTEAELLQSSAAPVLLLTRLENTAIASSVAPDQDRLGVMLPYSPLHVLLMAQIEFPLVMTSGNRSSEPQATSNSDASERLADIADGWLMHDRDILNRLDDSIMRVDGQAIQTLRRARGFAPEPLPVHESFAGELRILAMGGELKSTFCLLSNGQATLSQHIGDLEDARTFADYRQNLNLYRSTYGFTPDVIAVDMHPDYLSTQAGHKLADELGVPIIPVQHHHAHFASVLAENGIAPDEPALGIILDGLGLGDDNTFWGGEIFMGDCRHFRRLAHFQPVAMPGGAAAAREPWRNLVAHLKAACGEDWPTIIEDHRLLGAIEPAKLRITDQMINQAINAPLASSAGRLFDAVGAALDICAQQQDYEGQVGMRLEALARPHIADAKPYPVGHHTLGTATVISWRPLWEALLQDLATGEKKGRIAARFHLGVVQALVSVVVPLAHETGLQKVVMSGGVLNNSVLFDLLFRNLSEAGLLPVIPLKLPANDGGLSLGQAAIAAHVFKTT